MKTPQLKKGVLHILPIIVLGLALLAATTYLAQAGYFVSGNRAISIKGNIRNFGTLNSPCGVYGDINRDSTTGKITRNDTDWSKWRKLIRAQANEGEFNRPEIKDKLRNADLDGDGLVEISDLQILRDFAQGQIDTFPVCSLASPPEPILNTGQSLSPVNSTAPEDLGSDFGFYNLDGQTCHISRVNNVLVNLLRNGYLYKSESNRLTIVEGGNINNWLDSEAKVDDKNVGFTIGDNLGDEIINSLQEACQGKYPQQPRWLPTAQRRVKNTEQEAGNNYHVNRAGVVLEGDIVRSTDRDTVTSYVIQNGKKRLARILHQSTGTATPFNPCGYPRSRGEASVGIPSAPFDIAGGTTLGRPAHGMPIELDFEGMPEGPATAAGDCPYLHMKWTPAPNITVPQLYWDNGDKNDRASATNCASDKVILFLKQRVWADRVSFFAADDLLSAADLRGRINPTGRRLPPDTVKRDSLNPQPRFDWPAIGKSEDDENRFIYSDQGWLRAACDGKTPYLDGNVNKPETWYNPPGAPNH